MPNRDQMSGIHVNGNGLRSIEHYFGRLSELIRGLPYDTIEALVERILRTWNEERTIFVFGNGGSAASASHMMCDLNKGVMNGGEARRFKVMALTDNVPLLTAYANDQSYERVYAEQLINFVQPGDVAFAISGSGNSPNVLAALKAARERDATTLGITGYQGGMMKALCDICAVVPSENMQMIEDMHHAILHSMFTVIKERMGAGTHQTLSAGTRRLNT